jgi:hypothetical protein
MKRKAKPEEIRMQDQNIRQNQMIIMERVNLTNVTYEEDIKKPIGNKNITEEMIGFRIDKRTLDQLIESSKQYEVIENERKQEEIRITQLIEDAEDNSELYDDIEETVPDYDVIKWEQVLSWDKLFNFGIKKEVQEKWRKWWSDRKLLLIDQKQT